MINTINISIDGNSGTSRAIRDLSETYRASLRFNLHVKLLRNGSIVDDGLYIPKNEIIHRTDNIDISLGYSECQIILFNGGISDRLNDIYRKNKKKRKSTWLIDISCQKPDELISLFTKSYYNHYWSNTVSFYGPTEIEQPGIYTNVYKYMNSAFNLWNQS